MPYKSEIRIAGGVPTLYIDGQPFPAAAYMSYLDERADYSRFAKAGYKIFTFPVYFAGRTINVLTDISPFRRGIYDSEEDPDYTEVDREQRHIVRACPDACIIPRVNIAMPLWWEKQNPSELNRLDNGGERASFPFCRESFSSVIWRKTADRLLRLFIDHIGETPYASNIAGYHIASGGTEEWFHFGSPLGGLGECAERGYLRFISEKYPGDLDKIKGLPSFEIYKNGGKRISDINIIRFLEYTGEIVADSICHFAATVKSKTDRRLIVGSFYGYTLEITDARFGTHALSRLLRCPDIDFLSSPSSYMNGRTPGIDPACMSVLDSVKLHGKLFFTENDTRTYLTRPLRECRPNACKTGTYQGGVWEGPASPDVSLWVIRNCFARNLTRGAGQWWFDMWGGWYADDLIMADMKAFLRISEAALKDTNRSSAAEIAVIVSEESYRYTNPLEGSVFRQNYMSRLPLGLAGAPYDIYDLNDMENLPERIKTVVFLNLTGCEETAAAFCRSHPEKIYLFTDSEGTGTQNTRYTTGQLTTGILRGIYKEAGVHIYIETDDVVHVCENYIAVHAATAGLKTLFLKKDRIYSLCCPKSPLLRIISYVLIPCSMKQGSSESPRPDKKAAETPSVRNEKQKETRVRSEMKNKNTIRRLLIFTGPYRLLIILSFVCAAANVIIMLSVPVTIGGAVDRIAGAGQVDFGALPVYMGRLAAAASGAALMQWLTVYLGSSVTVKTIRDLRIRLFNKVTTLPVRILDGIPHGKFVNSVTNDVDTVSDGLLTAATQLFSGLCFIFGTLLFMASINLYITAAVVFLTPLSLITAGFISKHSYRHFRDQMTAQGELASHADALLSCRETLKAYNYEENAREMIGSANNRLAVCGLRAQFWSAMTNPSTRFVNALVYAAAGISGALFAVSGDISVGQIATFLIYAGQYTKPFNEISGIIAQLQSAAAAAARIFEIIDLPDETEEDELQLPDPVTGNIEFRGVDFSYSGGNPLIRDYNLSVKKGSRVAIVGPTGSGKTTVINLLMRFLDTDSGMIELDGTDITRVPRKILRRHFGMVLQDSWLFSGTIRENIAYGKPDATDAEIEKAAGYSHAGGFISQLPDGYGTYISGHNVLSYGQTQLICIARVMLADPPILILDEATSGIDARTEIQVQKALSVLMHGKTSVTVAHRLSTVINADDIVVMYGGRIAERGNHRELIEKDGIYAGLYRIMEE